MSSNQIIDGEANANLNVKFKNVTCETVITPNSERLTVANINLLNGSNSENLGLVNLYIQKNNDIVNVFISGFSSSVLTVGGVIIIDYVFNDVYDTLNGSAYIGLIPKSRTADLPKYDAVPIFYDNVSQRLVIKNTTNAGNFPNGENVIINPCFISWFANQ